MDSDSICEAVLDSLDEQIALIDHEGTIVYVNRAWKQFGIDNGVSVEFESVGSNYLQVCSTSDGSGDSSTDEAIRGIRGVASGDLDSFYYEYPCHGPDARRWFLMRVTRLKSDSRSLLVVSHHNITQRKLAEESAEHLARHDPLTGLPNRLHFAEFLGNEWRRSLRDREPISLVMLDVDHFKDYTDELGHPAGDRCLTKVGRVLQTFCNRASDIAVRYGGEEFAVLLGKTAHIHSQGVAEAIRTSIYDLNIRYGRAKRISISAGVASWVPSKWQDASLLLKEADKALVLAKRKGRNRVVFAGSVGNRDA